MNDVRRSSSVGLLLAVCAGVSFAQAPYDVELAVNGGFESGTTTGWTAVSGSFGVVAYGTTLSPGVDWPSLAVAAPPASGGMGGGVHFVRDLGNARMKQTIDVSAGADDYIKGMATLEASACLGGLLNDTDYAQVNFRFLSGGVGSPQIGSTVVVGPVSTSQRNNESLLVRRRQFAIVPVGTQSIEIEVQGVYLTNTVSGAQGLADNVSAILRTTTRPGPLAFDVEMVRNGGFENGWSATSPLVLDDPDGWVPVALYGSCFSTPAYGTAGPSVLWPTAELSSAIGGGGRFLRDVCGNARLAQSFDVRGGWDQFQGGLASVEVSAFLGGLGGDQDYAQINVRFYDDLGQLGATKVVGPVDRFARNQESILVAKRDVFTVPDTCTRIELEVQMSYLDNAATGPNGLVDGVSMKLRATAVPPALPFDAQLIADGGFEAGWTAGSPIDPADPHGWRPVSSASSCLATVAYGTTVNGVAWPSTAVAAATAAGGMDGGVYYLRDVCGNARLVQSLDVRGNTPSFAGGAVALEIAACLGGVGNDTDTARVNVRFYDAVGQLGATMTLGPIDPPGRNYETTLATRLADFIVPAGTERIEVEVQAAFASNNVAGPNGLADNVSAKLRWTSSLAPPATGTELMVNPSFEGVAAIPTSPLTLCDPHAWYCTTGAVLVDSYGGAIVPGSYPGGGLKLVRDLGSARIRQTIDLTYDGTAVDLGTRGLYVVAALGGYGNDADDARLNVWTFDANGSSTAPPGAGGSVAPLGVLGPVTPAQRGNITTLLERSASLILPPLTRRVDVELQFSHVSNTYPGPNGFADAVSAVLYDTTLGGPAPYPGTAWTNVAACVPANGGVSDDFRLSTGLNGDVPTRGPAYDVKNVAGGDVVAVRLDCSGGRFDYAPLILFASLYPTYDPQVPGSGLPPPLAPGFFVGQSATVPMFLLVDGFSIPGSTFGQVVLPGPGSTYTFLAPPLPAGWSILLQAGCIPAFASYGSPGTPCNGVYASTDAQELLY